MPGSSFIEPFKSTKPEIFSGSLLAPTALADDDLARLVVSAFVKIAQALPYIQELRERFRAKPRGQADILGCRTWTEFCEKRLNRTDRTVRHAILKATEPESQDEAGTDHRNVIRIEITETRDVPAPLWKSKLDGFGAEPQIDNLYVLRRERYSLDSSRRDDEIRVAILQRLNSAPEPGRKINVRAWVEADA